MAAQAREGALQQQLAVIDRQRFAAVERLRDVNRQLETVELEVYDINASIANLNRALARETDNLGARVRSLYKAGRTTTLETVLSSSSFSEALDRATSLERALAQDLEEIETLRRSRQTVQLRTADLAARLQQMDELRQEAAVIQTELQRRSQEQQDLIFGVQREQSTLDAGIDAFAAEAAVVGNRILVLRDIRQREIAQLERIRALQQVQEQGAGTCAPGSRDPRNVRGRDLHVAAVGSYHDRIRRLHLRPVPAHRHRHRRGHARARRGRQRRHRPCRRLRRAR